MKCKIVVAPHSKGKMSRHEHPVSQRGWRDAVRQAKDGAARGEDSTIFLACPRGDIRVANCSDINSRGGGSVCRLDAEIGGKATRILAGRKL